MENSLSCAADRQLSESAEQFGDLRQPWLTQADALSKNSLREVGTEKSRLSPMWPIQSKTLVYTHFRRKRSLPAMLSPSQFRPLRV